MVSTTVLITKSVQRLLAAENKPLRGTVLVELLLTDC